MGDGIAACACLISMSEEMEALVRRMRLRRAAARQHYKRHKPSSLKVKELKLQLADRGLETTGAG